ncbi:MAG: threonine/serine exporter family protein, partial [Armatimonadetes bacterium]|nr:threonine/serine exporter family protein [Anaerolineae bacterium]
LTLVEAQAEIQRIRHQPLHYSRRVIIVAVGMGCAAFCRLFGGDVTAVVTTLIAASIAMFTRQELHKHHLNPLLIVMLTAFTAGVIAGIGATWRVSERPQAALAASVLLLVPGVPLVNAAGDLLKGYIFTGTMRGVYGALISFCIALGLLLAMALTGVTDV